MAKKKNGKALAGQQSVNGQIKAICDIMRRSNCAGAMQYVPELTWILFLRILDEKEEMDAALAAAVGQRFTPSLAAPYRWRDWAAPDGAKRKELQEGSGQAFFAFVNGDLIPHLKGLRNKQNATQRQKVISEVMTGVTVTRIDTERNFWDVVDKVDAISNEGVDTTHVYLLSQVYEGLLLKMGEKNNDGGQFFTPREVIRAIVQAVDPKIGETVYDPCCGTGGFLAQAKEHMAAALGEQITPDQITELSERTFYGREKDDIAYTVSLANLVMHGIDAPRIWHGNTLTDAATYADLFGDAPERFDVILTNPPFGGKEGEDAQVKFPYKTGATEVLFLQHVMDRLSPNGRCGVVLPEGVLFRTTEKAFVQTKKKLLSECDLWCIVSLPGGVFTQAGAGVKTNLLFFTKGRPTKSVWYYDLSDLKVGKRTPLTLDRFEDFARLLPERGDSERSWSVPIAEIAARNYDLKAVNPNREAAEDTRTPLEVLEAIERHGREADAALAELRALIKP